MFYIFLADGFEEIEALCPYDLLLRAGIPTKTVSINETTLVTGTHGIKVHADITLSGTEETSIITLQLRIVYGQGHKVLHDILFELWV
jgi:4-methyl-5(b-hydroxyethyl)-thiazole monophosphate biosynthesis